MNVTIGQSTALRLQLSILSESKALGEYAIYLLATKTLGMSASKLDFSRITGGQAAQKDPMNFAKNLKNHLILRIDASTSLSIKWGERFWNAIAKITLYLLYRSHLLSFITSSTSSSIAYMLNQLITYLKKPSPYPANASNKIPSFQVQLEIRLVEMMASISKITGSFLHCQDQTYPVLYNTLAAQLQCRNEQERREEIYQLISGEFFLFTSKLPFRIDIIKKSISFLFGHICSTLFWLWRKCDGETKIKTFLQNRESAFKLLLLQEVNKMLEPQDRLEKPEKTTSKTVSCLDPLVRKHNYEAISTSCKKIIDDVGAHYSEQIAQLFDSQLHADIHPYTVYFVEYFLKYAKKRLLPHLEQIILSKWSQIDKLTRDEKTFDAFLTANIEKISQSIYKKAPRVENRAEQENPPNEEVPENVLIQRETTLLKDHLHRFFQSTMTTSLQEWIRTYSAENHKNASPKDHPTPPLESKQEEHPSPLINQSLLISDEEDSDHNLLQIDTSSLFTKDRDDSSRSILPTQRISRWISCFRKNACTAYKKIRSLGSRSPTLLTNIINSYYDVFPSPYDNLKAIEATLKSGYAAQIQNRKEYAENSQILDKLNNLYQQGDRLRDTYPTETDAWAHTLALKITKLQQSNVVYHADCQNILHFIEQLTTTIENQETLSLLENIRQTTCDLSVLLSTLKHTFSYHKTSSLSFLLAGVQQGLQTTFFVIKNSYSVYASFSPESYISSHLLSWTNTRRLYLFLKNAFPMHKPLLRRCVTKKNSLEQRVFLQSAHSIINKAKDPLLENTIFPMIDGAIACNHVERGFNSGVNALSSFTLKILRERQNQRQNQQQNQ